ncbi:MULTISPECIES: hypothetical protein [Actinomyces]|uniref:hypothetical protein n=1 Tax=Actinomyces TaxID=1654 RepID=UPI00135736CA|nr:MULTISPECIES: hypothetical protein [Actinomyces]
MRVTTRPGFGRVFLAELYKAACSLTVWVVMGATVVAVCVFSYAVGVPGPQTASMLAMLLGVCVMGAEYPSGAIVASLVAAADRRRLLGAQVCCVTVMAALPVVVAMLAMIAVSNPYTNFEGTPLSTAESIALAARMGLLLTLVALVGGFLSVLLRSALSAMILALLVIGGGQLLLILVPWLLTGGGSGGLLLPEWVNAVLPNAVFTRLLGGDFAIWSSWWDSPGMTYVEALAWVAPAACGAYWRMIHADF